VLGYLLSALFAEVLGELGSLKLFDRKGRKEIREERRENSQLG
jgi:hypothetical protein